MTKIDLHAYESARDFLSDIDLICSNALEYNPDRDPEGKTLSVSPQTLSDRYRSFLSFIHRQNDSTPGLHTAGHCLRSD